jgi:hypothetical protein
MAITSQRRIAAAQQFVRLGFGDAINDEAAFYGTRFLTQELTTTEAQAVLSVVPHFNEFVGETVAAGIERFRGRVSGWKFGASGTLLVTGSPLLVVVLPYFTHQLEEVKPGKTGGDPISPEVHRALISEMRHVFLNELAADTFEPEGNDDHVYAAWWD